MASALQKLFRKKLSKQHAAHTQQERPAQRAQSKDVSVSQFEENRHALDHQYLTVSSLDSPSSTSVHRGSSSSVSNAFSSYQSQADLLSDSRRSSLEQDFAKRARTYSVDASMMLRDPSGNSYRSTSQLSSLQGHGAPFITVDQFGSLNHASGLDAGTQKQDADEEEDVDNNVLYTSLMRQLDSSLRSSSTKVFLIPTRTALRGIDLEMMEQEEYVSLHAFAPSNLFKDQFESVSRPNSLGLQVADLKNQVHVTATLQPESESVEITIVCGGGPNRNPGRKVSRTLNVVSETTVYHTKTSHSAERHRERVRVRVIFVSKVVVPAHFVATRVPKSSSSAASSKGTMRNEQRKIKQKEGERASTVSFPTQTEHTEVRKEHESCIVPSSRYFLVDYAFLLDPLPAVGPLQGPLRVALRMIERTSSDFINAYVYVPGFDSYNASRIRRGILARAWNAFQEALRANGVGKSDADLATWLGSEGRGRLLLLLENVVMGHCHAKVYSSICALRHDADDHVDSVLATYFDHSVSLKDLGASDMTVNHSSFTLAEAILGCLGEPEDDLDLVFANKDINAIRGMISRGQLPKQSDIFDEAGTAVLQRSRNRIRTPLDAMDVMHATLEEICNAVSRVRRTDAYATLGLDDLLPLLAFVMIRAAPRKLASLLYYVRLFGISDATPARFVWALTTFDAVIHYLEKDPLSLCVGSWRQARSPTSTRSVRSSIRSPSPSQSDLLAADSMQSQERKEGMDRWRRVSLPSSAVLEAQTSSYSITNKHRNESTSAAAAALTQNDPKLDDEGPTVQPFKLPSTPASASFAVKPKRPGMTAWASENTQQGVSSQAISLDYDSAPPSAVHKRSSSMSGDLLIRPQIVVRAPLKARDGQRPIVNRPLVSRNGSASSRGTSPEPEGPSVKLSVEARRRSVDSWSSLATFGGFKSAKSDGRGVMSNDYSGERAIPPTDPVNDARSDRLRPSAGTGSVGAIASASSSSSWLPIWASEWGGMSRRPSSNGVERQNSGSAASHSRPESIRSQDGGSGLSIPLARSLSGRNIATIGIPSLDSMPSLERHDDSTTMETGDVMTAGSPHEESSILSSPSSVLSESVYKHTQQGTIKGHSAATWYAGENSFGHPSSQKQVQGHGSRRNKRRTRLLSASSPTEPLPPRLTTSEALSALPSLFASKATLLPDDSIAPDSYAAHSSTSLAHHLSDDDDTPHTDDPLLHHDRRDVAERDSSHVHLSSFTLPGSTVTWPAAIGSHLIKLQIPSPVDERTDPLYTSSPAAV